MHQQKEYIEISTAKLFDEWLKKNRASNVFLVADKKAWPASGAMRMYGSVLKKYEVDQFDDFSVNPKLFDVERGIDLFKGRRYDAAVAVGGGSAIDMAKLITGLEGESEPLIDLAAGRKKLQGRKIPLMAMPTTAGSGSEATHFAVVYWRGKKYSVAHASLLPDACIIDASLTLSCPAYLTAVSGMDALSQAIESYWSVNSTVESKRYSVAAIGLIMKHLVLSVKEGKIKDRAAMAKAAHLSGKAINITKTTGPHALSYTLTSEFNVAHGQAVGVFLPEFILYNSQVSIKDANDRRGASYVNQVMNDLYGYLSAKDAEGAKQNLLSLMELVGLQTNLAALGVKTDKDAEILTADVNYERLSNNPRSVTPDILDEIISEIR